MNHRVRVMSVVLGLCILQITKAGTIEASYWQCMAQDHEQQQWLSQDAYQRAAHSKALAACKKESRLPASCKVLQEACDYFEQGMKSTPPPLSYHAALWQCMALDWQATPWIQTASDREAAALKAKGYCQTHSGLPETCYINLISCNNIKE